MLLRGVVDGERTESYLNPVENQMRVLMDGTVLTCRAEREAVQAAEQSFGGTTVLTGGLLVSRRRFVFDNLIGKLIPVLEPLLEG